MKGPFIYRANPDGSASALVCAWHPGDRKIDLMVKPWLRKTDYITHGICESCLHEMGMNEMDHAIKNLARKQTI